MSASTEETYASKLFISLLSNASWQDLTHSDVSPDSEVLYNHSSRSFLISSFLSINSLAVKYKYYVLKSIKIKNIRFKIHTEKIPE